MDRVCVRRVRTLRDLRPSLSRSRGEMADLQRRRQRTDVAAGWPPALLSRRRRDDGCRCAAGADVHRRKAEEAVRWTVRAQQRAVGQLRRLPGRTASIDGPPRDASFFRDPHQRGTELARRSQTETASPLSTRSTATTITVDTSYGSNTVTFRFGTKPTGMRATSFSERMSTTDTSFVTGLAT